MATQYSTYIPHELVTTRDNKSIGEFEFVADGLSIFSGGALYTASVRMIVVCSKARSPEAVPSEPIRYISETRVKTRSPMVDLDSFTKIRESSQIKMSRYSHHETVTRYHVLSRGSPEQTFTGNRWVRFEINRHGHWELFTPEQEGTRYMYRTAGYALAELPFVVPPAHEISVSEVYRWSYWDLAQYKRTELSHISGDLANAVESVKSDVSVALHKRWDAMTDLFEVTPTYNQAKSLLVGVMNPLRTIKSTIQTMKSARKSHDEIASKWLEFRYGIMPVLYSAYDLMKLIQENTSKYQTERAQQVLKYETTDADGDGLFYTREGSYTVRATAKAYFNSPSHRAFSGTSLNVFNSIWETIPYSLVVDWFSNFGDWLYSQTNVLSDLSMNTAMCYTIKRTEDISVEARFSHLGERIEGLVMDQTIRHYDRIPFNQSDVKLIFDPKFNSIKRWIDSYALSIKPLRHALRRLK